VPRLVVLFVARREHEPGIHVRPETRPLRAQHVGTLLEAHIQPGVSARHERVEQVQVEQALPAAGPRQREHHVARTERPRELGHGCPRESRILPCVGVDAVDRTDRLLGEQVLARRQLGALLHRGQWDDVAVGHTTGRGHRRDPFMSANPSSLGVPSSFAIRFGTQIATSAANHSSLTGFSATFLAVA
jgi:hypothetical protein